MINNPLSQDEGVKFEFIHIAISFAHKHVSDWLSVTTKAELFHTNYFFSPPPPYYLKFHGNFLIYIYIILEEVCDPFLWNGTTQEKSQEGL